MAMSREGTLNSEHTAPSGQSASSHDIGLLIVHIGPPSISRQMYPSSHVNWKQFLAWAHITFFPPLSFRQYIPGPHVIWLQSVGGGGKTHLDLMNCLHRRFEAGHEAGTISSTHWRFPLHTLSLHLSTSHRSVTLRPFSRKKLGVHRPWQGFSRHSALRNRGHWASAQLSGHSVARSGQSSCAILTVSAMPRSTFNTSGRTIILLASTVCWEELACVILMFLCSCGQQINARTGPCAHA